MVSQTLYEAIGNERRRFVILVLDKHGPMTHRDMAEHVASIEHDKPVGELTSREQKRVYVSLYQGHLHNLANAGLVVWEDGEDVIPTKQLPDAAEFIRRGYRQFGPPEGRVAEYVKNGHHSGIRGFISGLVR